MMKRQRGVLRTKAITAKQRLASGFWKSTTRDQVFTIKHSVTREEDEFYERVKALLSIGVINPLSQLLDRSHIETLCQRERERYIFDLSEKIRECTRRYNGDGDVQVAII